MVRRVVRGESVHVVGLVHRVALRLAWVGVGVGLANDDAVHRLRLVEDQTPFQNPFHLVGRLVVEDRHDLDRLHRHLRVGQVVRRFRFHHHPCADLVAFGEGIHRHLAEEDERPLVDHLEEVVGHPVVVE